MKRILTNQPTHHNHCQERPKTAAGAAILGLLALFMGLFGCAAPPPAVPASPSPDLAMTQTFASAIEMAINALPTETPTPTLTPIPPTATFTPTAVHTPDPLPPVFTSAQLDKDSIPISYIADTCKYLKARWDPNNSAPGTVVMTIMYHSVTKDFTKILAADGSQVRHADVIRVFEHAHEVGFQTITAQQLADFLDLNAKIPPRSLLIIVDDRKTKEYYETHFIPHLQTYGWSMTNAWISAKDTLESLIKENKEVIDQGWVDPQGHGVVHNIPMGNATTDEYMRSELNGSVETIQKWFGRRPVAFIWPEGGFSKRSVELAREAGFRVGFTINPRGPVMYNWIPQAATVSQNHPSWTPEIPAGDPRMTLPRYWSSDAAYRIDDVIAIGDEAVTEAQKNRANELDYYDVMCKGRTGPIPTPAP